jgi:hypothetical protein
VGALDGDRVALEGGRGVDAGERGRVEDLVVLLERRLAAEALDLEGAGLVAVDGGELDRGVGLLVDLELGGRRGSVR